VSAPLLDANALIALAFVRHQHHDAVAAWFSDARRAALCPMTEGALMRYAVHFGEAAATTVGIIEGLLASPGFEFWPDDLSLSRVDVSHVRGRNQVTDAYLLGLVRHRDSTLVTFDRALAALDQSRTVLLQPR
jgi:toxin-antitoxin system PIN domain toxin